MQEVFQQTLQEHIEQQEQHSELKRCPHCQKNSFPIDAAVGIDQGYIIGLKRLISRSCGLWSYRLASENLPEFCGISLSYMPIGTLAEQIAEERS